MKPPRRDRPAFPTSYGIATGGEGMLDWERVDRALRTAATYWVSTTRADGTPHLIPIWGAWTGAHLYIEGGDDTVWARNLDRSPFVSVGADGDRLQIIARGPAARTLPVVDRFETIADSYAAKYPYRPELHAFWEIRPRTVLAWEVSSVESFAATPTRFHLEELA